MAASGGDPNSLEADSVVVRREVVLSSMSSSSERCDPSLVVLIEAWSTRFGRSSILAAPAFASRSTELILKKAFDFD